MDLSDILRDMTSLPAATHTRLRIVAVLGTLVLMALIARAFVLQVVQGPEWAAQASSDRRVLDTIPAPRGALRDRFGRVLAATEPAYRLDVAPGEFADTAVALKAVALVTGESVRELTRQMRARRYLYFHGPFGPSDVAPVDGVRGVHLQSLWRRRYAAGGRWATLLGTTDPDDPQIGAAGIERMLDQYLSGVTGEREWLKDARGRRYGMPSLLHRPPVPGCDITLTIDADVQALVEAILREGVDALGADGGDMVMTDPATGDVLALAGVSRDASGRLQPKLSPLTDPFEPGSTAKLFTAAAVLEYVDPPATATVPGRGGSWTMSVSSRRTRTLTDTRKIAGPISLHEAIQFSSNIGISGFAMQYLTPQMQHDMLAAFGFGRRTGVELGREAGGTLRPVAEWQPLLTMPSLAMGYEFQVTALQLAAAYGAIGNGGVYHPPRVIRDIACKDGRVAPVARDTGVRVLRTTVADTLRAYLVDAVSGTARRAGVNFTNMGGKTGTAIQVVDGRYARGRYTSSFAALVPAERPVAAIVVKIDNPKGSYYGGATAAPMARRLIEQLVVAEMQDPRWRALAAHALQSAPTVSIDRQAGTAFLPPVRTLAFDPTREELPATAVTPRDTARAALVGLRVPECVAEATAAGWLVRIAGHGTHCRTSTVRGDTLIVRLGISTEML